MKKLVPLPLGVAALALVLVGGLGAAGAARSAEPLTLSYKVTHSMFGDIGTYTNTIEPTADGTTVVTRAHFAVTALGVPLYREDARRVEQWQNNRLVAFHGTTTTGSGSVEVDGQVQGDSFVIRSPSGVETAPASVHPANPWSANFIGSSMMMRPDTGKLERVHVTGGDQTVVNIDGHPVGARKYEVDGKTHYSVWLDQRGVPVKFVVDDDSGKVTFMLANCSACDGMTVSYRGSR
jgi:Domain of unknown function (DUF6134)